MDLTEVQDAILLNKFWINKKLLLLYFLSAHCLHLDQNKAKFVFYI